MKKLFYIIPLLFLTTACAGIGSKRSYIVRDASSDSVPEWTDTSQNNGYKSDKKGNEKRYVYAVGYTEHANQRLCSSVAEARTTKELASQISQQFASSIETHDEDVTDANSAEEKIKSIISRYLHGVSVSGKYWEKRQYLEELEADEDKTVYACYVAVRISKANVKEAEKQAKYYLKQQNEKEEQKKGNVIEKAVVGAVKAGAPLIGATLEAVSESD